MTEQILYCKYIATELAEQAEAEPTPIPLASRLDAFAHATARVENAHLMTQLQLQLHLPHKLPWDGMHGTPPANCLSGNTTGSIACQEVKHR
jgi:hypothetical protein